MSVTLREAIEIGQDYHSRLPRGVNDAYLDALELLIKAGEREQSNRLKTASQYTILLPGERPEELRP